MLKDETEKKNQLKKSKNNMSVNLRITCRTSNSSHEIGMTASKENQNKS